MKPLVILRPEPGASETLARAQARGIPAQIHSLFAVKPVEWIVPDPSAYFGLLLSSANAVRYAGDGLGALIYMPVFAVGESTASAAREAGFELVVAGDGDVTRLLGRIAGVGPGRLLHLCGEDVTPVSVAGIELDRRIVYASRMIGPPPALIAAIGESIVVMLHSTRAAIAFATICTERAHISIAAISENVAAASGTGWGNIAVATAPRDDKLLDIADRLCSA